MNWFTSSLTPLIKELQELKVNQKTQQAQIIALLQEQNQLLKQLLPK